MMRRMILVAATLLATIPGAMLSGASTARAQGVPIPREAEHIGLHRLCDAGDRKACVKFGMMLGEMREHHVEWRRTHPEFFFWEH
jgi:hypothetical protein